MSDPGRIRSVDEHRAALCRDLAPLTPVALPVADAVGRVLAEPVHARVALPRFDHAAMDGFAVRAADLGAGAGTDAGLPVVGTSGAGLPGPEFLAAGTAIRIMTGAPMPTAADAVVPFEWTQDASGTAGVPTVRVDRPVPVGANIRRAGEDVAAGVLVAAAGAVLDPRTAGLIAATGTGSVLVHPAPRVAVLTTGTELVGAGADPDHLAAGAVHDSTAVTLVAELRALGAQAHAVGPAGDDPGDFLVRLDQAVRDVDLLITTGGISAGDRDVVKAALAGRDGFWFGPVAVRPGRPQGAGALVVDTGDGGRRVPVIALPGTPAATYLAFQCFVRPVLGLLAGGAATVEVQVEVAAPVRRSRDRTLLLPGRYDGDGRAEVLPGHAGHSQRLVAAADLILVVPPGSEDLPAGAKIGAIAPAGAGSARARAR
ncbi:molybdopterin molybdotransferase MoeA [Nocardioides sp. GY 10113]|uniref:molybdopterin molybdotransferase MoeA n=1 Tax=Nocardioides sp. GY 10113 TaxID=2569761 RepID=UPI0010A91AD0|nr:gephyrin-like molybdotransferase Glp [Nocardioides sp. GY 10113]TIC88240.1 molybdopterin molybdotransferase MoeA [Nocardioides sp. GY 10113]